MNNKFRGKIELEMPMSIPVFDIHKYLVHNDLPTPQDLEDVENANQMMITFLKLPDWLTVFQVDQKLGLAMTDGFLRSRGLKRSSQHAVYFCDHNADTEKNFELYRESVKENFMNSDGHTTFSGDFNVSK